MFSIGWGELVLVAALAVVLIKPREFPAFFRTVHQLYRSMANFIRHIKGQFSGFANDMEIEAMRVDRLDQAKAASKDAGIAEKPGAAPEKKPPLKSLQPGQDT